MLNLGGALVAGVAFAWNRQWLMSVVWCFSLAYIIFDKIYPSVLPETLVVSFAVVFLALVLISYWQTFLAKKPIKDMVATCCGRSGIHLGHV